MENKQTTKKQKPSESSYSQLTPSRHRQVELAGSYFLRELIRRCPWLVWMGVGAFLLMIISISIQSIFRPVFVSNEEPAPAPVVKTNPTAPTSNPVPWWLLGGFALGSAVSAIAIARRLHSSSQSQIYQRFQSASTRTLTRRQQRKLMLQGKQQTLITPPAALEPVAETLPAASEQPLLEDQLLELPENLFLEENTFLPEEKRPLDLGAESAEQSLVEETMKILIVLDDRLPNLVQEWEEEENALVSGTESLAEMLDIRKKLPLSAILGESFQRLGGKNQD